MKLIYLLLFITFLSQYVDCLPNFNTAGNAVETDKEIVSLYSDKSKKPVVKEQKSAITSKVDWMRERLQKYIIDSEKFGHNKSEQKVDSEYACTDVDSAVFMSTTQLIAVHGYPAKSYLVTTKDGYILELHRIPFAKNMTKRPTKTALLHHGVMGTSADWVISGPNKGLAFVLSEAGYDVWMANDRGNTYSSTHISRTTGSLAHLNYTFHDISQFDLPAIIDFITEKKGKAVKINYVGFSTGTTSLFAMLSTKTEYNDILRAGFALAPVAYMSNIKSPIELLERFSHSLDDAKKLREISEFVPKSNVETLLAKHSCKINSLELHLCENSMFFLCGFNENRFNKNTFPVILGHAPSDISDKVIIHYLQQIRNGGKFTQFDYGEEGNLREFGQATPPEYPLSKITLPIALFSSEEDWIAPTVNVRKLQEKLSKPLVHFVVPFTNFNHLDFMWSNDAPNLVYKKLLEVMEVDLTFKPNTINWS